MTSDPRDRAAATRSAAVLDRRLGLAALTLVAVGVLAILALGLRSATTGPRIGEPAPDFSLVTFDGGPYRLADLAGHVVVLNFWASWCETCGDEARALESIWQDYRDRGVLVIGIDYTDTRSAALAYLERHGTSYPNGPDQGGRISRAYRLTGVPETFVVDRSGRLAALPVAGVEAGAVRFAGPIVAGAAFPPERLRALLDRLLREGGRDA